MKNDTIQMSILVLDDDPDIRHSISEFLVAQGHHVFDAGTGEEGLDMVQKTHLDLVITDIKMPGIDGYEVLRQVKQSAPMTEVIVITAFNDMPNAIRAMREGAFDFFSKPFRVEELDASMQRTARFQALVREKNRMQQQLDEIHARDRAQYGFAALIGQSPALQEIRALITQVSQTETTSVLIQGETGTGKELVAQAIHYESNRSSGPLVSVDCSTIPKDLVESEFFGHTKGAFTNAVKSHRGHFERADGGTLFLDEIGEMDLSMQTALLRTLETRQVRPVGSEHEITVDVRVVSASNRNLAHAVSENQFREDLYYRLNTFTIPLPPLRERPEDILPIAHHFLTNYARELRKPLSGFSPEAVTRLQAHPFPGNARELKNTIERAAILCQSHQIEPADLQFPTLAFSPSVSPPNHPGIPSAGNLNLANAEKRLIEEALTQSKNNKTRAAKLLGISRSALRRKINRYGL